jgi:hypothetical protein
MSEHQAHRSCAFLNWHRRFLLAYESALRDQDPKFACVTVPYYDVVTAYVELADKRCSSMYDCTGMFEDVGGKPSGGVSNTQILSGRTTVGAKYSGYPLNQNCDDNGQCGFLLRGDLTKRPVPSSAGFGNIQNMISSSKDYATMLTQLQYGIHNEVHSAVGGAMATFASPRDPFFYMWHSAVDMFVYTYHQCHIGTPLTENDVMTSLQAFAQRSQKCGDDANIDGKSNFIMRVSLDGQLVDISQHPTIGKYFSHVGDEQWQYADITQLGDYSYTYELPTLIRDELVNNKELCKGQSTNQTTSVPPTPSTLTPNTPGAPSIITPTPNTFGSTPNSFNMTPTPLTNTTTTPKPNSFYSNGTTPPTDEYGYNPNGTVTPTLPIDDYVYNTTSYWAWFKKTFDALLDKFNGDKDLATQQMNYIECLTFNGVFGVSEFTPEFVKNFHLASNDTSCKKKVDKVEAGIVSVAVNTTDFNPDTIQVATNEEIMQIEATYAPKLEGTSPPEVLHNKTSIEEANAKATPLPEVSVVPISKSPTDAPIFVASSDPPSKPFTPPSIAKPSTAAPVYTTKPLSVDTPQTSTRPLCT